MRRTIQAELCFGLLGGHNEFKGRREEAILPRGSASWVAPAVAEAAIASGVARRRLDLRAYRRELTGRLALGRGAEMAEIVNAKRPLVTAVT